MVLFSQVFLEVGHCIVGCVDYDYNAPLTGPLTLFSFKDVSMEMGQISYASQELWKSVAVIGNYGHCFGVSSCDLDAIILLFLICKITFTLYLCNRQSLFSKATYMCVPWDLLRC